MEVPAAASADGITRRGRGTAMAVGRTLAQLDLRARTGVTVLAITRDGGGTALPIASETLRAGDVLALVGSQEAVAAARAVFSGPESE